MTFNFPNIETKFIGTDGLDLGRKLITKDYLLNVYPTLAQEIGITPELWGWGNNYGILGINNTITKSTPVTTFAGGANWRSIANGGAYAAAIKTDGTLWVWGVNDYLQLGINALPPSDRLTPVTTFSGGSNWRQVACGYYSMAAIKTDGTLWTWGSNTSVQLGNNTSSTASTPVTTFAGGTNWKQVSCANNSMIAIKTDGTLWVWGNNGNGQLGINNTQLYASTPVTTFAGGTNWKQVSGGHSSFHVSAIKTDGTLWVWGNDGSGQLGTNSQGTFRFTPVTTFAGGTNWEQVSVSRDCTAAIKTDGTLWTWGANTNNQAGKLGDNTTVNKLTPVTTFAGGTTWKQVSGGYGHLAAIKTDGTLWGWGADYYCQLGTVNPLLNRLTPITTFAGGSNWKQVTCGYYSSMAIESSEFI